MRIHPRSLAPAICLAALTTGPFSLPAQESCPAAADPAAGEGWTAYQADDMDRARNRFQSALDACPDHAYALTGLGYVELRAGDDDRASLLFLRAVAEDPESVDALTGLGLLGWRAGDLEEVRERFTRVRELDPDNPTALEYLDRLPEGLGPAPERQPLELPDTLQYHARAHGDQFQVRGPDGTWEPFWIKGVNLGAALPGRYASQFPDSVTYAEWIASMAKMGANVIRLYTIHPPDFYEALADHNRRQPDNPLRLVHGVWTELPPGDDYTDSGWEDEFFTEMRRVVDLLHGRADIPPRPGHAAGFYTADVSDWVLAYIIGREWEPFSVTTFDSIHPGLRGFEGEYLTVEGGNAMDAWLGKAVEEIVAYETETYREQRPAAYTNWPTLDPLHHPTETTRQAEVAIREALGETVDVRPREFNNDSIGLDASLVEATDAYPAGYFASYHAYPYYPDLMVLNPEYRSAASSMGPSAYFGYLSELKAHHPDTPVVIAEYGVPASLGLAHLQPDGWHHGGHTEASMAETNRRLTLELAEAGMAGGIVFAWIDEWFKQNWIALEFELPPERNRLWLNRLDAEQHYGMWAMEPEPAVRGSTLEERLEDWRDVEPLYSGEDRETIRAASDEAYLWLLVEGAQTPVDPGELTYLGFDMIDPGAGDFRWPGQGGPESSAPGIPVGVEFVLRASAEGVRLLVDPPQNPFRLDSVGMGARRLESETFQVQDRPPGLFRSRKEQRFNLPYLTRLNRDGIYDSLQVITNRRRFARDSTEYLAMGYDRGVLPEGPPPDGMWEQRDGALEIRIPWMLLNVTDPSSRTLLQGPGGNVANAVTDAAGRERIIFPDSIIGQLGTTSIEGIRVVGARRSSAGVWRSWPGSGSVDDVAEYRWQAWEEPEWRARRRPVWGVMQRTFEEIGAEDMGEPGGQDASEPPADTLETLLDRANTAWVEGEQTRARELYSRVLAADSTRGVALHRIALMTAWEERHDRALRLFDQLLDLQPENISARVDRARVLAWSGELEEALEALDRVLSDDPTFRPALEARAQFLAWAGRYDASLSAYDDLVGISGGEPAVQRSRARVLGWASRFEAARAAYDSVLSRNPDDLDARLGLARVHALSDELEEAREVYRSILADESGHPEALRGLARALTWGGDLPEGEGYWRRALEEEPENVEALIGLGQNLRWQGRNAAALRVLERAQAEAPRNPDLREQLRWIRASLAPGVDASFVVEDDSDENRMATASVTGRWYPVPRLGLRVDYYRRGADQRALEHETQGVTVSGSYQLEPGWTVSAGLGGSESDAEENDAFSSWSLGIGSPGRYRVTGNAYLRKSALDATAALVANGVEMTEYGVDGRWSPAPGWLVNGSLGGASLEGSQKNSRMNTAASVTRTLTPSWRVGVAGRAFWYDKDLVEGYFDPDFYGIGEALVSWLWEPGPWSLRLEAAPGVQQVTSEGDVAETFRASAGLAYRLAPGREISVSGGYSSTGLQSFSTGDSDYEYTALIFSLSWVQ